MTTPFEPEFIEQLKGATGWRFGAELGPTFTPVFFCCTNPNQLSIVDGKEPVAVIDVSPNPAFVGNTITLDGSDSYDPDGTVTGYQWTIPGGTPSSSTAASLTATWAAPGEYQITLIVTDGTGLRSAPARVVIQIQQTAGEYYIAADTGLFYTFNGGVDQIQLFDVSPVNAVTVSPSTYNLTAPERIVWIATNTGVFGSVDGGITWLESTPPTVSNKWGDSPAPDTADFTWHSILLGGAALYVIGRWSNSGGIERSWIFYTTNGIDWIELQ